MLIETLWDMLTVTLGPSDSAVLVPALVWFSLHLVQPVLDLLVTIWYSYLQTRRSLTP
jgi:hypothetical protein